MDNNIRVSASTFSLLQDAAQSQNVPTSEVAERILQAHFKAERDKRLPDVKQFILTNLAKVKTGQHFIITDIMDSEHAKDPKKRRAYGQLLAMLIARRSVRVVFTGNHRGAFKLYHKL